MPQVNEAHECFYTLWVVFCPSREAESGQKLTLQILRFLLDCSSFGHARRSNKECQLVVWLIVPIVDLDPPVQLNHQTSPQDSGQ
jgi:hypothetical protein